MTVSVLRMNALQYFARHPHGVSWFERGSPSKAMIDLMIRKGEVEKVQPPGGVGMVRFKLTAIGRARLGL